MEKVYTNIWILFTSILIIIIIGFFKTYFSLFPTFKDISISYHIHTFLFLLWFALLFIQPYLIKKGNRKIHGLLGKLSYVLVPFLVISIFIVTKGQYQKELDLYPKSQCIANLIVPLPQMVLFVTLYLLAIINIKNTGYHVRYMIGTSLVLIGPGLGRVFILLAGISFIKGVEYCFIITELVLIGLILYDKIKGKKYKPYALLLIFFFAAHLSWYFLPQSPLWQIPCGKFVDLFF